MLSEQLCKLSAHACPSLSLLPLTNEFSSDGVIHLRPPARERKASAEEAFLKHEMKALENGRTQRLDGIMQERKGGWVGGSKERHRE